MTSLLSSKVKGGLLLGFIGILVLFYSLSGILLPFSVALVLSYILNPGVEFLEKRGIPRVLAALGVVLILFLLIGSFLFGVVPFLKDQLVQLIKHFPTYAQRAYEVIIPYVTKISEWKGLANLQSKLSDALGDMASWGVKMIANILTSGLVLANLLSLVVIMPILVFYLLRDWKSLLSYIGTNLPRPYAQGILKIGRDMNASLGGYIRGQSIVCLCLCVIYTSGLSLVGLHYAFILGIMSGLSAFIPYIGFIVSFFVAISLALGQFQELSSVGLVVSVYMLGQIIEASFLTPKFIGDRIGVHPVWIIFSLLVAGNLFGFLGVLFALPLAAMGGVLVRSFMHAYRSSIYYKGYEES